MILAIAFCERDQDLMLKNIKWWNELGGCKGHKAVLWRDPRTNLEIAEEIKAEAHKCFDDILVFTAHAEIDGWPEGANYFFRIASGYMQNRPEKYFLWMEPDAIPLKESWMDYIENEYLKAGKPFMGDRVEVEDIPVHMSGIGVYFNPLHEKAGEAYRAHDTAWDMAAKDQIVPNAHFTNLIEHAWQHPSFTSLAELETQINPKTILFHSSKDGSLINLMRQKRGGNVAIHDETKGDLLSPSPPLLRGPQGYESPLIQEREIICDIFIKTYPKDYEWLNYSLRSIQRFCSGFRKIWVVSPEERPFIFLNADFIEWKSANEESEDGYLAQQITKLYADVITDYQADCILHVDSDVIITQPITPRSFFGKSGNIVWPYTPYKSIETPWQPITEKFIGHSVDEEFMRRFPIMIPRWLYGKLREYCSWKHNMVISQYIRNQPHRAFSEFNALGAFAWNHHHDKFEWFHTMENELPEPFAKQYHSWGGFNDQIRTEIEMNLALNVVNVPKPLINLGGKHIVKESVSIPRPVIPTQTTEPLIKDGEEPSSPAQNIKELPGGIWVIADDTHVSKWIEQQGRLDHDMNTLPFILPYINKGDTVIDAGAFIGDHTIAYAKAVGPEGKVYAFEPNPIAFKCLKHNMAGLPNVYTHSVGLSDTDELVPLSGNNGNHGGAYVGEHMKLAEVGMERLDDMNLEPDLIKLDIEGCEVRALIGATATIEAHHPTLIIEVNEVALKRQQCEPKNIFFILETMGYKWKIMQENCHTMSPMYDIIAWHEEDKKPVEAGPHATMLKNVKALADYANESNGQKVQVVMALLKHKIIKKRKK